MAKEKTKQPGYERPLPFPVFKFRPLLLAERERLREIINDPVMQLVIRNAHAQKPKTGPVKTGVFDLSEQSLLVANNRLHQLQGWEMFEAALFGQAEEAVHFVKPSIVETFPTE